MAQSEQERAAFQKRLATLRDMADQKVAADERYATTCGGCGKTFDRDELTTFGYGRLCGKCAGPGEGSGTDVHR